MDEARAHGLADPGQDARRQGVDALRVRRTLLLAGVDPVVGRCIDEKVRCRSGKRREGPRHGVGIGDVPRVV